MNPNPENEQEELYDDDDAPITLMDWVIHGISALWFQRQFIFGLLLLVGLGYGIYRVYIIPPKKFEEIPTSNVIGELPTTDLNFGLDLAKKGSGDDKPKVKTMEDIILPEKTEPKPFDPILDAGTVEELIEESLRLRSNWVGKVAPKRYEMFQRRAKIARKLLQKPISESQHIFALGDYIESLVLMDNLVCEKKYKVPQVRMAMQEIAEKYTPHPHKVICAKANLAAVLIHVHDFLQYDDEEHLKLYTEKLPSRLDKISQDKVTLERLAGMTVLLHQKRNWDGSSLPYCMEVVRLLDEHENELVQNVGVALREKLNFEHLEPKSLVDRIGLDDFESRRDVKAYFQALENNPNVRLRFFQVGITAIRAFKQLDKKEDYQHLVAWLRRITPKVKSESSRKEIYGVLKRLEALPFGKIPEKEDVGPNL